MDKVNKEDQFYSDVKIITDMKLWNCDIDNEQKIIVTIISAIIVQPYLYQTQAKGLAMKSNDVVAIWFVYRG